MKFLQILFLKLQKKTRPVLIMCAHVFCGRQNNSPSKCPCYNQQTLNGIHYCGDMTEVMSLEMGVYPGSFTMMLVSKGGIRGDTWQKWESEKFQAADGFLAQLLALTCRSALARTREWPQGAQVGLYLSLNDHKALISANTQKRFLTEPHESPAGVVLHPRATGHLTYSTMRQ